MSVLDNFGLDIEYDISDLVKSFNVQNKYIIFVFEYAHESTSTKFHIVDNLKSCTNFLKNRYAKFKKEKDDYKYIEEDYFDESSHVRVMTQYGPDDADNIFATNIQIYGVNENEYKIIKKEIKKIFGDYLFRF
jgi:hypothetical protein